MSAIMGQAMSSEHMRPTTSGRLKETLDSSSPPTTIPMAIALNAVDHPVFPMLVDKAILSPATLWNPAKAALTTAKERTMPHTQVNDISVPRLEANETRALFSVCETVMFIGIPHSAVAAYIAAET
ncbi:MAG: hypothetical protein LKK60_06270 [Bifidobacterium tibiigranuli]|nr:hypothetical protein [Bifidobacterium tibiigranuli]MCI2185831.1 hypothetical protein [Bifidobacterium tibiigranuli]